MSQDLIDPLGKPTAGRDHCFRIYCPFIYPYVHTSVQLNVTLHPLLFKIQQNKTILNENNVHYCGSLMTPVLWKLFLHF